MDDMKKENMISKILLIAGVAHAANRELCLQIGDDSQVEWSEAEDWQVESAYTGVLQHLISDVSPEQSHQNWMDFKIENGWTYGEVKDPKAKTHPSLVPYNELPNEEKIKDYLFASVVSGMSVMFSDDEIAELVADIAQFSVEDEEE